MPSPHSHVSTFLDDNKVAMHTAHFTVGIYPHKLQQLLNNFKEDLEFAGVYDINEGAFYIDPNASRYDDSGHRPYSLLDPKNFLVVWHSHPFVTGDKLSFPSIEDLDLVRLNPQSVFLITTYNGIYVISAKREITSIDSVTKFYRSMNGKSEDCNRWNYETLKENFLEIVNDSPFGGDIFNIVLLKWKDAGKLNEIILSMCDFKLRKERVIKFGVISDS